MSDGVVFVEIPSGSRNKYEWDDELGGIALDRRLFTSMSYPADYGYVEGTLAEDGDPLDALVLVGEPTFPGCRIRVRAVGVFHMADEKGPDEKVLCVPLNDPSWSAIADIHDVPPQLRNEIEHFFQVYKDLEGKKTETRGFGNRRTRRRSSPRAASARRQRSALAARSIARTRRRRLAAREPTKAERAQRDRADERDRQREHPRAEAAVVARRAGRAVGRAEVVRAEHRLRPPGRRERRRPGTRS